MVNLASYKGVTFVTKNTCPTFTLRVYENAFFYIERRCNADESKPSPSDFVRNELVRFLGAVGVRNDRPRANFKERVWKPNKAGYYQVVLRLPSEVWTVLRSLAENKGITLTQLIYRIVAKMSSQNPGSERIKSSDFQMPEIEHKPYGRRKSVICCGCCGNLIDKDGKPVGALGGAPRRRDMLEA